MSRRMNDLVSETTGAPRVSGDEPVGIVINALCKLCSPRERG